MKLSLRKILAISLLFAPLQSPVWAQKNVFSDISSLLNAIQTAAKTTNYSGSFIYQQGAQLRSSYITHVYNTRGEYERIELQDAERATEFLRTNDQIKVLNPDAKTVVLTNKVSGDRFPGILVNNKFNIANTYRMVVKPNKSRIAGYVCQPVLLESLDDYRYSFRLCVDTQTNLLLKVETLGLDGGVIEQVSFSSLRQGSSTNFARVYSKLNTQGWKILNEEPKGPLQIARVYWSGSTLGFSVVENAEKTKSQRTTGLGNQFVLSDGLVSVSVFIERVQPGMKVKPTKESKGLVSFLRHQTGDHVITLVGEVPIKTLEVLLRSIKLDA